MDGMDLEKKERMGIGRIGLDGKIGGAIEGKGIIIKKKV